MPAMDTEVSVPIREVGSCGVYRHLAARHTPPSSGNLQRAIERVAGGNVLRKGITGVV